MLMQSICGGRATWERASNDQFICDEDEELEDDDEQLLPEELLLHVMSFMDHPAHLCTLAAVCRRWHRCAPLFPCIFAHFILVIFFHKIGINSSIRK
jgi:hypothetical protein